MKIDTVALKRSANNRWPAVLSSLGGLRDAADAFGSTKHVDCPFPARHTRSGGKKKFRLYGSRGSDYAGGAICTCGSWSDGIAVLMDINGWSFTRTCQEINEYLGDPLGSGNGPKDQTPPRPCEPTPEELAEQARQDAERKRKDERLLTKLRETWDAGLPVTSPEAEPLRRYLASRGIPPSVLGKVSPTEVRFHPNLVYLTKEFKVWGEFPALLSLLRDKDGNPRTLHRTYLSHDGGKAALPNDSEEMAKKLMPYPSVWTVAGGAIQLFEPTAILSVTEGIETALAVRAATGTPVWPTYSASMLKNLDMDQIPDVALLLIWADKDRSGTGQNDAAALKQRAWEAGKRCQVLLPDAEIHGKGVDWNDVLETEGLSGFPDEMDILGGAL